ncbi:Hypothetical protein A7982_02031 [Minicystis rosea]|nr:Hypothetical protein A7982_02031 [Minicystis rosea]
MHVRTMIAAVASAFVCLHCHDRGAETEAGLPCEVDAILRRRCQSCHGDPPSFGAPMPLVSFADLHAPSTLDPAQKVYQRVAVRIHDDAAPMPPAPNALLDTAARRTLSRWIQAGAPAANEACAPGGDTDTPSGPPLPCQPDRKLAPSAPIPIPAAADTLRCYGIDVDAASKRHVIAVAPRIDNVSLLHHMTLFQANGPFSATPTDCGPNGELGWRALSVWAPGANPIVLPPEAGFPEEGTTHYVVQVHYQNLNHLQGHEDTSGFDLCTTSELRPNDADVLVFGTQSFSIPAHGDLDIGCCYDAPAALEGRTLIYALPHMHRLGTRISTVLSAGGEELDLGERSPYQSGNQYWSPINATAHTGNRITTRCTWKNDRPFDVGFGESDNDEMCWSFTLYYPKAPASFEWTHPALSSVCKPFAELP